MNKIQYSLMFVVMVISLASFFNYVNDDYYCLNYSTYGWEKDITQKGCTMNNYLNIISGIEHNLFLVVGA